MAAPDENSRRSRVMPVFSWLRDHGGHDWPRELLLLTDDAFGAPDVGPIVSVEMEKERRVPPSAERLLWLIENADSLAPRDGRRWREYRRRVAENPNRHAAIEKLRRGDASGIDRRLRLEGSTSADCLIECSEACIWIEGKRNDWLEYSSTWDVTRDQLARDAEAAWLIAHERGKRSFLIICHEHPLKHHERALLDGYRHGTWSAGWPHLSADVRRELGASIGTLTWSAMARNWSPLSPLMH